MIVQTAWNTDLFLCQSQNPVTDFICRKENERDRRQLSSGKCRCLRTFGCESSCDSADRRIRIFVKFQNFREDMNYSVREKHRSLPITGLYVTIFSRSSCVNYIDVGFGLVTGFIGLLKFVITIHRIPHIQQFTTAGTESFQSAVSSPVFWYRLSTADVHILDYPNATAVAPQHTLKSSYFWCCSRITVKCHSLRPPTICSLLCIIIPWNSYWASSQVILWPTVLVSGAHLGPATNFFSLFLYF
jgi:hypothetical protein